MSVVIIKGSQLLATHMYRHVRRAAAAGFGEVEYRGNVHNGSEIRVT